MKSCKLAAIVMVCSLACAPAISVAKEYLGFDLCGMGTAATIKATFEKSGASVTQMVNNLYPDEVVVIAKNYPVENSPRNISVALYKYQIAYISVGNAGDLAKAIETKYGATSKTSKKEEKTGITTNFYYYDKADSALELTVSQFDVSGSGGTFFGVNYACKSLIQQLEDGRSETKKAQALKKSAAPN
jgi:hypothetical protein